MVEPPVAGEPEHDEPDEDGLVKVRAYETRYVTSIGLMEKRHVYKLAPTVAENLIAQGWVKPVVHKET